MRIDMRLVSDSKEFYLDIIHIGMSPDHVYRKMEHKLLKLQKN